MILCITINQVETREESNMKRLITIFVLSVMTATTTIAGPTIDDFKNNTIVVQNDLDGNEERIVIWNHTATQPTVAELEAVTLEE